MVFSSKSALNSDTSPSSSGEDDVSVLRAHIDVQEKTLAQQSDIIKKKSEVIDQQKKRIAQLEEHLRLTRAQRFGPSSEKHPAQQEMVFNSPEAMYWAWCGWFGVRITGPVVSYPLRGRGTSTWGRQTSLKHK